ncbi:TIGR02221 family CRISPR-associated protein [Desulfolucanica intricata]|uniref:TIGR02221 family CRISPR-associated protein n=1 Tax=Desulfolucanica intricata TaxID=1285191 RepID=UPI0008306A67|nr:TIGR02221 family CRISPR-associated protein [Desulfolucanica intricata]
MSKLVTFIGTGDYKETYYNINGEKILTRFFPVAAAVVKKPDQVLVIKTKAATSRHWDSLRQELLQYGFPEPVPVDIPDGKSTGELWEIFSLLVEKVDEQDNLVFDITHSFRSLPLISFLSIAYLKFVKNVNIDALYYGAYDARDEENNITPAFNLTDFCSLLDWIIGVNSFVRHGSAREFGNLLTMAQKRAKEEQGPERRELNNFGKIIEGISRALFTTRPFELMDTARKLKYYKEETEQRNMLKRDVREWAAPFGVLMDTIIAEYSAFAGEKDRFNPFNLEKHLAAARWYVEHNYTPQALSIMRELVISITMCQKGQYEKVYDRGARELTAAQLYRTLKNSPAGKIWTKLVDLRNDVIHAEWRENSTRSSHKVIQETRDCLTLIEEMFSRRLTDCPEAADPVEMVSTIKVLITPLGMSPGLLYTALSHIKPDLTVVLTSREGKAHLEEITARAGYRGKIEVVEISDPFAGYSELPGVIEKVTAYLKMLPLHRIYINLAGGTTLLQYMTTRIAGLEVENCEKLTTVAMIDRRPAREQQETPYVKGEMIVIE